MSTTDFIGKISKYSKGCKVICIPSYLVDRLGDLEGKHLKITLEEF